MNSSTGAGSAIGAFSASGVNSATGASSTAETVSEADAVSKAGVSASTETTNDAYVGDFQNCLKWGYAANVPMELIEYGDPDGQGDLKKLNQILLRTEAYIGWGILDGAAFGHIFTSNA